MQIIWEAVAPFITTVNKGNNIQVQEDGSKNQLNK